MRTPNNSKPSKPGSNSYSKKSGSDKRESSSKNFSKPYIKEDRPKKSFDKSDDSSGERKPYNRDEKPKRSFDEYRSGKKSFDRDDRPKRSFDKPDDSRAERKPFNRDEKPKINIDKYRSGKKSFGNDERPKRMFDKSEDSREDRKPFNRDDRNKKSFDKPDYKGAKKRDGDDDKQSFDKSKSYKKPYEKQGGNRFGGSRKFTNSRPSKNRLSGTDEIRLNRYIANAGICSRREADVLIADGLISINGKVVTELGTKVKPTDTVQYAGEKLRFEKNVYILMNKPKNYITTLDDPRERNTVIHLLEGKINERVYPVGRLDRATTGVLILTNDGILTKKLTHPKYGIKKIYAVETTTPLKDADVKKLETGFELEDGFIKADKAYLDTQETGINKVILELHSGKNRIVRRMMEHLGYEVKLLDRISFAGLTKKNLLRGRWRILTEKEIGYLMKISSED
jgi:23S rRNA pseudouridine2605 synthase